MDTTYIVVDEDLNIMNIYACSEECKYPDNLTQLAVPTGQNAFFYSPVRNEDGTLSLVQDPVKVENWTQSRFKVLRDMRDMKLSKCDWTQGNDVQLSADQKAAWAVYRQALRDLPANTPDPANPTWPTPPN
jgi:hypothetical protein